jgi:hypothetical protein
MKQLFSIILLFISLSSTHGQANLSMRFQTGERYLYDYHMKQVITQTIQGNSIVTQQENGSYYEMEIKNFDNNIYTVLFTYKRTSMKIANTAMNIEYDSAKSQNANNPITAPMAALVGQSFTMKMTPKGKVLEVTGMDELIDTITETLPKIPGQTNEQIQGQLKKTFGNDAMKKMMEMAFKVYPENPVKINDSWEDKVTLEAIYPIELTNKWTLKNITAESAVIDVHSILTSNAHFEMNGVKAMTNLKGSQKGEIVIEKLNGIIKSSKVMQNINGSLTMSGFEIPIKITSNLNQTCRKL